MNLLEKILDHKRAEVGQRREALSLDYLKSTASIRESKPDFLQAIREAPMGLIAEIKRKSPSAGTIREDLHAGEIAERYLDAGATALSILMDQAFFGGEEADFVAAREASGMPLLYKEFVVSDWQVWHAASLGASAVLLIVAALNDQELESLMELVQHAGMTALVEVHTEDELKRANRFQPACIGINNRDLTTFETTIDTTFRLIEQTLPASLVISESGIGKANEVSRLRDAGVEGLLVGEHLLRQPDLKKAVADLMSMVWASS